MLDTLKALAAPTGAEQTRERLFGFAWGPPPSPAQPCVVVSDAQILALVEAAHALSRRRRHRVAAVSSLDAEERLLRLDWAVQAGRLVLAERAAARALTPAAFPAWRATGRLRVDL